MLLKIFKQNWKLLWKSYAGKMFNGLRLHNKEVLASNSFSFQVFTKNDWGECQSDNWIVVTYNQAAGFNKANDRPLNINSMLTHSKKL